jgi:FRG domain.
MEIKSAKEALTFLYALSLNKTNLRFRGQANNDWSIKPSIYRFSNFLRYQTALFEKYILEAKPPKIETPLIHTDFELEWLMTCQHYGIPTRLMDWSTDILSALFFACYEEEELKNNGAIYVCNQDEYPLFNKYDESLVNSQELAFISTNLTNPRMRSQSGCFMIWGISPIDNTTETYDLLQYQQLKGNSFFLKKLIIPSDSKQNILKELELIYSISHDSMYLKNGYLEKKYANNFKILKEGVRLKTLYQTNTEQLSEVEEKSLDIIYKGCFKNMYKDCVNLRYL